MVTIGGLVSKSSDNEFLVSIISLSFHSKIEFISDFTFSFSTLIQNSSHNKTTVSKSTEEFIPTGIPFKIKVFIISFTGIHILSESSFTVILPCITILSFFLSVSEVLGFLKCFFLSSNCFFFSCSCFSFLSFLKSFLVFGHFFCILKLCDFHQSLDILDHSSLFSILSFFFLILKEAFSNFCFLSL